MSSKYLAAKSINCIDMMMNDCWSTNTSEFNSVKQIKYNSFYVYLNENIHTELGYVWYTTETTIMAMYDIPATSQTTMHAACFPGR